MPVQQSTDNPQPATHNTSHLATAWGEPAANRRQNHRRNHRSNHRRSHRRKHRRHHRQTIGARMVAAGLPAFVCVCFVLVSGWVVCGGLLGCLAALPRGRGWFAAGGVGGQTASPTRRSPQQTLKSQNKNLALAAQRWRRHQRPHSDHGAGLRQRGSKTSQQCQHDKQRKTRKIRFIRQSTVKWESNLIYL